MFKDLFNENKMSNRNYLFKAHTVEAYIIKSLSEVLQNTLTDVCFTFNEKGVELLTVDNKTPPHLLVHLVLNGESFDEYFCPKPLNIGVNLQHLHKMLKSIKKKDKIMLFINKNSSASLGITTIPSDSQSPVTSYIKIQKLSQVATEVPNSYSHPIHIPTGTYQKLCKDMQGISNQIQVYAKGTFLKFSCKVDGLYTREVPFGTLDEESEDDEYQDEFHTKSLSQLIKVSGLNSRMQVYIPSSKSTIEIPSKLSINTGQLGKLDIYIKSISQINSDTASD